MMSITPYTIAVPQADLEDLKARLAHVRWTNELPGVGTEYGVSLDSVKRLVKYWQEAYDWRIWEAKLNAYPQFTTTLDGQNIHFLHVRSPEDNALPLILTHGWPMSVVDYLDLIGPLTDPRAHGGEVAQSFHLVIPSLPGFGFSGPTTERGWDRYRVARAWAELMRRLGYDCYGAQGMDWGSIVSPEVGRFDHAHVIGVHVTEIFSFPSGDPTELEALSEEERNHWQSFQSWIENKGAYNTLHSTVPQTLAHALADSPVGQLAWNYQIYGDAVSFDYILTNVMIYWLTNTAASSARFYYENAHAQHVPTGPTTVPLGLANFADVHQAIRLFAERDHNNIVSCRPTITMRSLGPIRPHEKQQKGIKTDRTPADLDAILKTMNDIYRDQASMKFVIAGVNPSLNIPGLGGGMSGVRLDPNGSTADHRAIKD